MFSTLINAFKIKETRTRLLYMLLVLFIFRIGTHLPVPGLDLSKVGEMGNSSLYQMIAGGNYGTVFAMGIGPYINASIIMQLLTVAIPKLEQINKEGEEGRRKINQYTRVAAVILSLLQGCGQVYTVHTAFIHQNFFVYIMALVTMVTGTIFVMWMGEKLTEVGIGNGASFLIFANILSGLASGVAALYTVGATNGAAGWVKVAAIIAVLLVVMVFVIFIQDGERRIPVQYSKKMVGRRYIGGQSSYIPIKVNIAGVMSIIFAISLLQFPYTINQLFHIPALETVARYLSTSHPVGAVLYVILIFCFTFFYTGFAFNPVEVAENIKKSGGFVPGIRPGKPTSDYIQNVVDRISLIGACAYAFIALVPILLEKIFNINVSFGGTTLLIVTGVALEIVKQLEAQMLMRHYKGFLS
ncbi:MAG: preprotein translocase subunit SecY [Firmicutes bacterium]|nr:preprotein translocase subunit SecY [Bacillota bacterium]